MDCCRLFIRVRSSSDAAVGDGRQGEDRDQREDRSATARCGAGGGRRGRFSREGRGQSVTLSRDGLDVFLAVRRLAEGLANREDVVGEIGFLDGGVGPYGLDEFLLGHEAARIRGEHREHVERLRRERRRLAVLDQETFVRDKRDRAETDRANGWPGLHVRMMAQMKRK